MSSKPKKEVEKKTGFQTDAADSNDLTTVASVKEFLDITVADWDDLIQSLISRMSTFITTYCGRKFHDASYDEKYDGEEGNGGLLLLNNYPVLTVVGLWDDLNRAYGDSSEIASSSYVVYLPEGSIRLDSNVALRVDSARYDIQFQVGLQNIRCSYTAGYTTIPFDIENACNELVALKLNTRKDQGVKSEKLGRWSVTYGSTATTQVHGVSVSASVAEVLNTYKNKRLFLV